MSKPSSFELELIQKIVRATIKLESSKTKHHDQCPIEDVTMAGPCTCGANEYNRKIDEVLSELMIE